MASNSVDTEQTSTSVRIQNTYTTRPKTGDPTHRSRHRNQRPRHETRDATETRDRVRAHNRVRNSEATRPHGPWPATLEGGRQGPYRTPPSPSITTTTRAPASTKGGNAPLDRPESRPRFADSRAHPTSMSSPSPPKPIISFSTHISPPAESQTPIRASNAPAEGSKGCET